MMEGATQVAGGEFGVDPVCEGRYTVVRLPKELHRKQTFCSPRDGVTPIFEANIVGWCFENGMPSRVYYQRDGRDIRHATVRVIDGALRLVEDAD